MRHTRNEYNGNDVYRITNQVDDAASGRGSDRRSRASQVVIQRNPYKRIGMWNVRTMLQRGKLENVKREMERYQLNILGLCEVRWKDQDDFMSDDVRVISSGGSESSRGVALLLDKDTADSVTKVIYHSDRLLLVRLKGKPIDIVIIVVYMPTSDHPDDEVDKIYDEIEDLMKSEKGQTYTAVLGDWNASLGEGRDGDVVGPHGLGNRNDRGDKLAEFCQRTGLFATNTWFEHTKRHRYTWKQPGDVRRYQIDFILVKKRYRNSVLDARTYPGADANTDHNLVVAKVQIKLKKICIGKRKPCWNREKTKGPEGQLFREAVEHILTEETDEDRADTVEEKWERLKNAIQTSAMQNIGKESRRKGKKPWVTQEMLDKMDERRKWKNVDTDYAKKEYRRLNNELRRVTDSARDEWWKQECKELEELAQRGRHDLVYEHVRRLCQQKKGAVKQKGVLSETGELLTEQDDIKKRWVEYIEQLYAKEDKPDIILLEEELTLDVDEIGPAVLKAEIEIALKELKTGKAEGTDNVPSELIKILGEGGKEKLTELCMKMYDEGKWPSDFQKSILIPIEKKANTNKCEEHRTISLISHASKIMLKVLHRRLEAKAEEYLGEDQFGFRRGKGTREAIAMMRVLSERNIEHNQDIYVCFVDFEKAFDRVMWEKLMEILKKIGVDWKDRRLIAELYMNQEVTIRVNGEESSPGTIGRGVRQGCPLSPLLFNIYVEEMVNKALETVEDCITVGGCSLQAVRYADDQAMITSTEEGLQEMVTQLNNTSEQYGMKINIKKTKVMKIGKLPSNLRISINGQILEQVTEFKYLGSVLCESGRCSKEIRTRIGMAKNAFMKRKELFTRSINLNLKKRLVKSLVWSILLYASEAWTIMKSDINRLEAFEMWCWRRILKIKWTDRINNERVLETVGEERKLIGIIQNRKRKWVAHSIRHNNLLRLVLEGRIPGKRSRGRKRIMMLDSVTNGPYGDFKRRAMRREV